jgi:molecular chaperone HtpG
VRWISGGTGDFEVEQIERAERGTSVILHLRDDAEEFLNAWKLKQVIGKYSDHISLPILMEKEEWKGRERGRARRHGQDRRVGNRQQGQRPVDAPKKDITDEQYQEFYKAISHDFEAR